jgi:hypothetical protein
MLGKEEIHNRFGFHKATIEGPNATAHKHAQLRALFIRFAELLDEDIPAGRYMELLFDRLEEASMWAHKAIAQNGELIPESQREARIQAILNTSSNRGYEKAGLFDKILHYPEETLDELVRNNSISSPKTNDSDFQQKLKDDEAHAQATKEIFEEIRNNEGTKENPEKNKNEVVLSRLRDAYETARKGAYAISTRDTFHTDTGGCQIYQGTKSSEFVISHNQLTCDRAHCDLEARISSIVFEVDKKMSEAALVREDIKNIRTHKIRSDYLHRDND